jgi:long-chain acyl-CoA synthetase
MVIVGGYNVYPREVDEVLLTHPEVLDAASAGAPDPYYGETLSAAVVVRSGASVSAADLIAFCKQNLAPYKVPKRVYRLDALPRTAVGKLDKLALRATLSNHKPW